MQLTPKGKLILQSAAGALGLGLGLHSVYRGKRRPVELALSTATAVTGIAYSLRDLGKSTAQADSK